MGRGLALLSPHAGKQAGKRDFQRGLRTFRMPGQPFVSDLGSLVPGPPALDNAGIQVHDPILGNPGPLEPATLHDSVISGGAGGKHLHHENRIGVGAPVSSIGGKEGQNEQIGLGQLIAAEAQVGGGPQGFAEAMGPEKGRERIVERAARSRRSIAAARRAASSPHRVPMPR